MDITFHYPPELFNLLADTIPLLFRSKKGVLLFFRGAGVNEDLLDDISEVVNINPDSIYKHDIATKILTRLNEKGESTLRERREVLKRVIEFEDFSTCWPKDQLSAKGLVAEIQRVVNVKDSFTRMKQEFEKERTRRQEEHQAELEIIKQKQKEKLEIKQDLYSLFRIPDDQSQKRGKLLEGILNRLFNSHEILIRESFELVGTEGEGVIEQIDGVVEIDNFLFLVEIKWWKEPLGKGDVSPHLVNVYGRGHVGGILISNSGFTSPAIAIFKEALVKKIVILCDLEEIIRLIEREYSLKDFFKEKINAAAIDKNPFYKPLG